MQKYFKILGLTSSATEAEIKKAFRKKAMQYHPDRCKLPDAEERFIEINEAYEYLTDLRSGKIKPPSRTRSRPTSNTKTTSKRKPDSSAEWTEERRKKARERARKKAKMEHEEFLNSEFGQFTTFLSHVRNLVILLLPFLFLLGGILLGIASSGVSGFLIGCLVTAPIWFVVYMNKEKYTKRSLKTNFYNVFGDQSTYKYITVLGGIVFFFWFVLSTAFNPLYLIASYAFIGTLIILLKARGSFKKWSYRYIFTGIIPFTIGLYFCFNYAITTDQKIERHTFEFTMGNGTLLRFKNNAYEDYFWLRWFFDPDEVTGDMVVFSTAEGILGMKVIKNHKFVYSGRY